ncbi:hypothetical protein RJT34_27819 [Clitoria ternatea]|uniref:Senescence-associated carboxylesterase 101 n=1 Tax=Clitoria ternatea TaxID=43366 RepID=A0AAN9I8P8_CLITE
MTQSQLFSSGFSLSPLLICSGILSRPWRVISSRVEGITTHEGKGLTWKVYPEPDSDLTILAFEVKPDVKLEDGLVSSSDLKEKNFHHFDFLCAKKIPTFKVNTSAISLFYENREGLDQLKSEISSSARLIVTGHALGGSIATLFTLLLLNGIGAGKKRPLCITFGSPLIGDKNLQQAISRSSTWSSSFLHVVSNKDPLPKALHPDTSAYMPFGMFLFCSDSNFTCFENPDSILKILKGSIHDQNQESQATDYGNLVEILSRRAIYKDSTARPEDLNQSSALRACITSQLWALGLTPNVQRSQQKNIEINTFVTEMERLENKFIIHKMEKFDPSKKLNTLKIDMAKLEWYKKNSKNRHVGYYDSYRKMDSQSDQDVILFQKNLANYWKDMVEEAEMKPQKEGAAFRTRWLYAGTNYRRMVEPLTIADYYRDGHRDYVKKGRSRHYEVLEEWLNEARKDKDDSNSTPKKNVELILTIDSCFWAHVEEALICCQQLEGGQSSEATDKLLKFEDYVYGLLKKYEVSPEIFLKDSSYMAWWNQYKAIKGTTGNAALATFMSSPKHYDQYTEGLYNFP